MEFQNRSVSTGFARMKWLGSVTAFVTVWLMMISITLSHYAFPSHDGWVHDLLRRAYYLPIVIAAFRSGLTGGLFVSALVTLAYIPHAFLMSHHFDPADSLEKILEIALYMTMAAVAGVLSDREYKQRLQLQDAIKEHGHLTAQLVRAGRLASLGEVVAGIAHEIKNPLHSLAGTAEVVDAEIDDGSDVKRMWDIHKSEIERLKRVANRFLSFARPTGSEKSKIDLRDAALRLEGLIGAEARQKDIVIKMNIPGEPVWVNSDLDGLAQVGLNVAVNAIKAMEQEGEELDIAVGSCDAPHGLRAFMRISNNGPAIDEAHKEHIFDPFYSESGGTGLGLSVSAQIIAEYGGIIEAENTSEGVAFTVYIKEHS